MDWKRLATGVDTLVVLMGLTSLLRLTRELIAHGRPSDTPVARVRHGTTEAEETIVGTLADIATKAARAGFTPPVLAVIGEIVRLRDRLGLQRRPAAAARGRLTRRGKPPRQPV